MKTPIKNMMFTIAKKLFFFCMSMVFTAFLACSNEEAEPGLSSDEKEAASFESQDDYYFDDADDMATEAFMSEDFSGGKVSTDTRITGAVVLHTGTLMSGALKIDFGTGVTDARGNLRKGLILLEHVGQWNAEGASWTITFSGYSINGISIEGTRKVTVVSVTDLVTTLEVELIDGKITWPDGSVATRSCHHVRQRVLNSNHLLDRLIVYGTAQGTFRNGRGYSIEILEELVYDRSCADAGVFIAVQGKKLVKHGARELTIDYGDGTCDNIVTLTNKSGFTVRYEVSK